MYIVKNALRCIGRAKGRNILIGVIAVVIALSACLGLSIRQAAESAKEKTLDGLSVTATISFDRQSVMKDMQPPSGGEMSSDGDFEGFDREAFSEKMGGQQSLTLEEYQTYAKASTVQDFYYTQTVYLNESDSFAAVTTETEEETESTQQSGGMPGFGGGGFGGMMGGGMGRMDTGDFTLIGYSGESAMTDFVSGNSKISNGEMFSVTGTAYECLISEELATYNDCEVNDKIVLQNPNNEEETYTLTVVGIYTSTETNQSGMSVFGIGQDPANEIYMSYTALNALVSRSESGSQTVTDEDTGREYETALTGRLNATYVFADPTAYETFEEEVRTLGLGEDYTVSSGDLTAYQNSLTPLETLSTMAGWFLVVILAIGGVVLIVLNIFNIRERKYEIGVLTAMGMKKWKVATQFMVEILAITMVAVVLGGVIGGVSSVPVTNGLLQNQIESQQQQTEQTEMNFGRPGGGQMSGMPEGQTPPELPSGDMNFGGKMTDYVSQVDSAMNLTVVWQLLAVGVLLTLIAGGTSVLFVMRYDPLKILANRD